MRKNSARDFIFMQPNDAERFRKTHHAFKNYIVVKRADGTFCLRKNENN